MPMHTFTFTRACGRPSKPRFWMGAIAVRNRYRRCRFPRPQDNFAHTYPCPRAWLPRHHRKGESALADSYLSVRPVPWNDVTLQHPHRHHLFIRVYFDALNFHQILPLELIVKEHILEELFRTFNTRCCEEERQEETKRLMTQALADDGDIYLQDLEAELDEEEYIMNVTHEYMASVDDYVWQEAVEVFYERDLPEARKYVTEALLAKRGLDETSADRNAIVDKLLAELFG